MYAGYVEFELFKIASAQDRCEFVTLTFLELFTGIVYGYFPICVCDLEILSPDCSEAPGPF